MTNEQMHANFEAFMRAANRSPTDKAMFDRDANGDYVLRTIFATFFGWQAATLNERERCALVAESAQYPTLAAGIRMPPTGTERTE